MNNCYRRALLLGSQHVDCCRRLRTSTLFALLQNAAIRHTESLGMGRDKTLDRGLLWVVGRQYVEIARMPVYDERIVHTSWPGDTLRVLFPRYDEITDEAGNVLLRASAVWTLMDAESRSVAFPEEYGVAIPGVKRGGELPLLPKIVPIPTTESFTFTVPYSYVDINGHMNNTRYFDVVEDNLPWQAAPRAIQVEYLSEVRRGETLRVQWGREGERFFLSGETDRPCFRMSLQYRNKE